jgi:hypothetical protein
MLLVDAAVQYAHLHANFDLRLRTLNQDRQPLVLSTHYLWSVEQTEPISFSVDIRKRMWWLWNGADIKTRLSEVEARLTELPSYAEK